MTGQDARPQSPDAAQTLDHVGLIVRDLHAAQSVMSALGFELTARADHTMTTPDGRTVSAGSSQHAIMLGHGYVELMQITDPGAGHQLAAAPHARFGLHILALATPDAEAAHARLLAAGQAVGPIRRWARAVDEPDRKGMARFVYFDAPWVPQDPSYLCWVQHLTPELMRASDTPVHPNGARAVQSVTYRGPAPAAQAWVERLARLGLAPEPPVGGVTRLSLGASWLVVQVHDAEAALVPAVLALQFRTLDEIGRRAARLGLPAHRTPQGGLWIDLQDTLGIALLCSV